MDIEANIRAYMGDRKPDQRYTSFDYCFNYFQAYREQGRMSEIAARGNMQLSCLQLGFYLASWGMFRGSTLLPGRSLMQFEPVVELIAHEPPDIWEIDANCYSREACNVLLELADRIRRVLRDPARPVRYPTTTLATKVMMGVLGNVPAFDTFFKRGFGAATFGPKALKRVAEVYQENAEIIERHRIPTLDFDTGKPTNRAYTAAKVIDEVFFIEGGGSGSQM